MVHALAIAALVWNALGCMAYLADVMLSPEDVAAMSDAQRAMYESRPAWAVSATAVAVWGGLAGCVGLVVKKRWAAPLLMLSLAGIIVQDVGLFVVTEAGSIAGPTAFILQGFVLLVGIGLVVLARRATVEGWIT